MEGFLWYGEQETYPDLAVQTLLQFLKLVFLASFNRLQTNIRTKAFNEIKKVRYLQKPGRLPDCVTSSNRDSRSALGSALVLRTAHSNIDFMA